MEGRTPKLPGARTIVRPHTRVKSKGGIIFPDSVEGVSALSGTVIAVGTDCTLVKVGDVVSFAPYSKFVVPTDEGPYKDHFLINEQDILIIWELNKRKINRKKIVKKKEAQNA